MPHPNPAIKRAGFRLDIETGANAMILKNCRYMKSAEFKERQGWLAFTDAVGIVLEVMSKTLENLAKPKIFFLQNGQPTSTWCDRPLPIFVILTDMNA